MNVEEARRWLLGERSTTNYIPRDPHETWEVRIAQADAAMMQQAYYILKAHELRDERRFKAACAAMQGMCANPSVIGHNAHYGWGYVNCKPSDVAVVAWDQADALLAAEKEAT